ncbi:MAG: DUF5668 domain-containing protein [Candidatus Paceibacterota bacterium]|jgi:hypothetical protein
MGMKVAGYALLWFGVLALMKNVGILRVVDWSVIWPVLLIVAGLSLKHCKHGMMCMAGGKCGMCGKGDGHKCEGDNCNVCKK